MNIGYDEMNILKIYICQTQEGTIHNLSVAYSYFSQTSDAKIISNLLEKIRRIPNFEFERLQKQIMLEQNQ